MDPYFPSLVHSGFETLPPASPIRREVSVIVPCYNVESTLQRAFNSVYTQTYGDFHLYAVDDGSSDNTSRILEANAHRCFFVTQPNAGPAAARNRAIRMSDSPFVAFLDADDEWLPLKLERQVTLLKQNPSLGLVCSFCSISEPGKGITPNFLSPPFPVSGRLFRHLARNCFVYTPTVVVRRCCLDEVGLFNESLHVSEDFNLWLRIAARWQIALLPELLAITHKRPESLSATVSAEERLSAGVTSLQHALSACPHLPPLEQETLRHALAERFYFHGSFLLSVGQKDSARKKLSAALKLKNTHTRALAKLALTLLPASLSRFLFALKSRFVSSSEARNLCPFGPRDIPSI